jgi:hypothetical protein
MLEFTADIEKVNGEPFTIDGFIEALARMPKAYEPYTAVLDPDVVYEVAVMVDSSLWLDMPFRIIPNEKAGRLEERWRRKLRRRR